MEEKTKKKAGGFPFSLDFGKNSEQSGYTLSPQLRKTAFYVLLFFCVFIPFRTPIADLTFDGIKAVTDLLTLGLFVWFSVEIKCRYRFYLQDLFFLGFLFLAFVSTVFLNRNGITPVIVQVRSIGMYYIFYFVIRNFGFGKEEFLKLTRTLQYVSIPLFVLALIEKISYKTLLFPASVSKGIGSANYSRVYSMFCNPNTYGLFITLTLILTWVARIWFEKKTNPAMYVLLAFSIWLSMSRSSLIALTVFAAALLVLLFVTKRIGSLWKSILLCTAVVLSAAVLLNFGMNAASAAYYDHVIMKQTDKPANPDTSPSSRPSESSSDLTSEDAEKNKLDKELANKLLGLSEDDRHQSAGTRFGEFSDGAIIDQSNANGRMFSVKTSLRVLRDYPLLGAGFGSYGSAASLSSKNSPISQKYGLSPGFYSDIEYAKVIAENGILGTLLFGLFLLAILFRCRGNLFKTALCLVIGWFGLFFNIFEVQIGAMLFWSLLAFDGIRLPLPEKEKKENEG